MTNELEKAKFYLDEAHRYFDATSEARRKLDEKIYNVIALSGVLVNLIFGLSYFFIEQKIVLRSPTFWLLGFSIVSYLIAVLIGLYAYRPTDIFVRDIKEVIKKYEKSEQESELVSPIQHLAWNISRDAEDNQKAISTKGICLQLMLIAFFVGLVFLLFAFLSLL
jgi:hypothetical protein